jgi:hypothetical protein
VYIIVLANLPTLSGYYARFAIGLVKDINWTRSSFLYWDNLLLKLKNLKDLKKYFLTASFQKAIEKEYNNLKYYGMFKTILKEEVSNKQILPLKWVFKYKFNSNSYL